MTAVMVVVVNHWRHFLNSGVRIRLRFPGVKAYMIVADRGRSQGLFLMKGGAALHDPGYDPDRSPNLMFPHRLCPPPRKRRTHSAQAIEI